MTTLNTGLMMDDVKFNLTSLCLNNGLQREIRKTCENVTGMWQLFTVLKYTKKTKEN
jgi:hypothetical protein